MYTKKFPVSSLQDIYIYTYAQLIHLLLSEKVAGTTKSAKKRRKKSLNWRLIVLLFIDFNNFYSEILIFYLS